MALLDVDDQLLSRVAGVVANDRRRRVCRYLAECEESRVTLDELAGALGTEPRSGRPPPDSTPGPHERAKVELHHVHLPKLDDARVVEYRAERRVVETGAALPVADQLARTVSDDDP